MHHPLQGSEQPLFKQIVLDLSQGLQDTFAYISDINTGAIVVYSLKNNISWSIESDEIKPENNAWNIGEYQPFYMRTGVYGLALVGDKLLSSRLGKELYSMKTQKKKSDNSAEIISWERNKPGFSGSLTSTSNGELFIGTLDSGEIRYFNTSEVI